MIFSTFIHFHVIFFYVHLLHTTYFSSLHKQKPTRPTKSKIYEFRKKHLQDSFQSLSIFMTSFWIHTSYTLHISHLCTSKDLQDLQNTLLNELRKISSKIFQLHAYSCHLFVYTLLTHYIFPISAQVRTYKTYKTGY